MKIKILWHSKHPYPEDIPGAFNLRSENFSALPDLVCASIENTNRDFIRILNELDCSIQVQKISGNKFLYIFDKYKLDRILLASDAQFQAEP